MNSNHLLSYLAYTQTFFKKQPLAMTTALAAPTHYLRDTLVILLYFQSRVEIRSYEDDLSIAAR